MSLTAGNPADAAEGTCCTLLLQTLHSDIFILTIIQKVLNASKGGRKSGAEKEAAGAEVASSKDSEDWHKQKDNRKGK